MATKKCQYCGEEIQELAIKCKHCGSNLKEEPPQQPKITTPTIIIKNQPKEGLFLKTLNCGCGIIIIIIVIAIAIASTSK